MSRFKGTMCSVFLLVLVQPRLVLNMDCPRNCNCSMEGDVRCVGNLTDVPRSMPQKTYRLHLNKTNVRVLNQQSLSTLPLMLHFSISHSPLDTVQPDAFQVARQLRSIKLPSNLLASLPPRVFRSLDSLEKLHLNGNRLEFIPSVLFEGLVRLIELDVSNNAVAQLAPDVFQNLSHLRFLNLGMNSLRRLPPTVFHSLTRLQYLTLYKNRLETLEPDAFKDLYNLLELRLNSNQISQIPHKVFWALGNLNYLTMSSNQLQGFPEKSFYHLPKLTKLTIYTNPLLSLPEKLMGQMPLMKEFYLFYTNLTTVPWNLFANMSRVTHLHLHLNSELMELPPDLFCCLPNIQHLSLRFNNIQDLHPDLFSKLANLTTLYLNDNRLHALSRDIFKGNPRLNVVNLGNNSFQTFQSDILSPIVELRSVTLSGNPWNCTCDIRDMAGWVRQNEGMVTDLTEVKCNSPFTLKERPLRSLSEEEFQCGFATDSMLTTTYLTECGNVYRTAEAPGTRESDAAKITRTTHLFGTLEDEHILMPPATQSPPLGPSDDRFLSLKFHSWLVMENRPEFVHNNRLKGWTYMWTLSPNQAYVGFLMALHIVLMASGVALILAAIYGMYRLNKAIGDLGAVLTNRKQLISERKQKY
ncbi:hypothetical protein DPEC_G00273270 [Dallia pectoralis]|uniref:Uncharacterized protein n=1 Tax=Dallia pectoralis TaxID=75939 RepID=A0ACC2FQ89_DALPE|nr:hypothetical protein DPEC_G00273270 [Dallia pectoralis]